jgi:hypothetical protein
LFVIQHLHINNQEGWFHLRRADIRNSRTILVCLILFILAHRADAFASIFGSLRTLVHDPQHRPIANATVVLKSRSSDWRQAATSNAQGMAQFLSVPIGQYEMEISSPGFDTRAIPVTIVSDSLQEVHAMMSVASAHTSVEVSASATEIVPSSSTVLSTVNRNEVYRTAGADRTNSLSFITDYVPGAYVVHDQLHVRGGHQVTWAIDGVPIPNTNIASNVGPQFDPKDIDFVETQRGGILADYGDRAYGVFNVSPKSGFERQRLAEVLLSYGSLHATDNQVSFGDHSERFAYYVSANGNRTDYGLEPPGFDNLHNQSAGGGAFTSLTYNAKNGDQWRIVGSGRADYYQVPNDPTQQASGLRDREREQDAFLTTTWLRPFGSTAALTVSPFVHFNRAVLEPSTADDRASTYFGGQAAFAYAKGRHNAKVGVYAFGQRDNTLFAVETNRLRQIEYGDLEAIFVEDQFKAASWLTFNGGVRLTRFAGGLTETAASPRLGAALRLPIVHWILRGSYGRFYQAPPLSTVSSALLGAGQAFLPLRGERDAQVGAGLTVPWWGWALDVDLFRNTARNYFDHDALGNSNIFLPLTIDRVRVRGLETSVRSPRLLGHARFHLAYSHQSVRGEGGVTGGLTDFSPPPIGFFYLDHDQRDTLSTGVFTDLPRQFWLSTNLSYGSGFLNGDGPGHLPAYHTEDLALGKDIGERWAFKLTATNIANSRYFIDLSNTFGGSHVSDPRMVSIQVRYRFHY